MEQLIVVPKTQSCFFFFFQVTISSRTRYYEYLNDKIVSRQKTDVQRQYQLVVPQRRMQGGTLRATVRVVSRHLYHASVRCLSLTRLLRCRWLWQAYYRRLPSFHGRQAQLPVTMCLSALAFCHCAYISPSVIDVYPDYSLYEINLLLKNNQENWRRNPK